MKRSLKLFAVAIVFSGVFCFSQCRKDNPKPDNPYGLPNATQTGAGVFACLINGQKFIAGHQRPYFPHGAQVEGDSLYLNAAPAVSHYYTIIGIYIKPLNYDKNEYAIDAVNVEAAFGTDSTCLGFIGGITSYSKTGNIVITKLDTARRIVSGTFEGLTFAIPGCDTLHVTNGRFDYYYYYH
jgi:hypothetical protein